MGLYTIGIIFYQLHALVMLIAFQLPGEPFEKLISETSWPLNAF